MGAHAVERGQRKRTALRHGTTGHHRGTGRPGQAFVTEPARGIAPPAVFLQAQRRRAVGPCQQQTDHRGTEAPRAERGGDEFSDDESLDVDADCVLVLKNCGPKGYPGMAEVGNMPLPPKVLRKGITDMVRISDARMSGTAYGTVVLHTSPEAAAGGPLALVKNGDLIELDVPRRRLHLHVGDEELARRRAAWTAPPPETIS